jgi:hypothetical protein
LCDGMNYGNPYRNPGGHAGLGGSGGGVQDPNFRHYGTEGSRPDPNGSRSFAGVSDPPPWDPLDCADPDDDFKPEVAQPGRSITQQTQGSANSFGVGTELSASSVDSSQSEQSLTPFAEQRRLVDLNTGLGGSYEFPSTPGQVLQSAARGSPAYTPPAQDTRTQVLRPAPPSQNAAGGALSTDQASSLGEIARLNQAADGTHGSDPE